ncbi:TPA: ead/Ea22-like family protein, partial [Enterobacter asburiae]|nr:ead/Ea22-like family protein [Enterobacter asburiae]
MSNIDKQQLREAAQQCSAQEPLRIVEYHGKMCLRNSGGIVFTVLRDSSFPEYSSENENYARLAELSNTATVLALLDEL